MLGIIKTILGMLTFILFVQPTRFNMQNNKECMAFSQLMRFHHLLLHRFCLKVIFVICVRCMLSRIRWMRFINHTHSLIVFCIKLNLATYKINIYEDENPLPES